MAEDLASYRRCIEHIHSNWAAFLEKRKERLKQQEAIGMATEKVAENILEDLFTIVLDWSLSDINYQMGYADFVLSRLGVKYLVLEVKRPGALAWNRRAVGAALDQAVRYADAQKVRCVGVSDGMMLYVANIEHGGLQDRVFVSLETAEPQETLWWLSLHGVYRPRKDPQDAVLRLLPEVAHQRISEVELCNDILLHPKYKIPARCFAFIGKANDPKSWKLPYCLADGSIDVKRLPKAIQAILSNYRGVKVSGIPEQDIPNVLVRLARAAASIGRMPHQSAETAPVYQQLADVLEQVGRLEEVTKI